ncbi:MAG: hypothetical protein LBR36_04885 [Bacteroidales bacterium]|jgi:hypothetical protein|nr:hypothetical protein [Bacteroidales bacterium]
MENKECRRLLVLFVLILFCNEFLYCQANKETIYKGDPYCVFLVNDSFRSITEWEGKYFCYLSSSDTLFNIETNTYFYKQDIPFSDLDVDSIMIASFMTAHLQKDVIASNFNLKIHDTTWNVDLYYQLKDSIKGNYLFTISQSEQRLFNALLKKILADTKNFFYNNENDTTYLKSSCYQESFLYVNILAKETQSEYFGSMDVNEQFSDLYQLVAIIIGNHISIKDKTKKRSENLNLLDIREKFNNCAYKVTGIHFEDYWVPPPPPKKRLKK